MSTPTELVQAAPRIPASKRQFSTLRQQLALCLREYRYDFKRDPANPVLGHCIVATQRLLSGLAYAQGVIAFPSCDIAEIICAQTAAEMAQLDDIAATLNLV